MCMQPQTSHNYIFHEAVITHEICESFVPRKFPAIRSSPLPLYGEVYGEV